MHRRSLEHLRSVNSKFFARSCRLRDRSWRKVVRRTLPNVILGMIRLSMKIGRVRGYIGSAVVLLAIVALALWQWKALARFAITAAAVQISHVRLSARSYNVDARSRRLRQRPCHVGAWQTDRANRYRIALTYDLRDLLPGGERLFGLKSVNAYSPHVTIVRHADGGSNVPSLRAPANNGGRPSTASPASECARWLDRYR